MEFSLTGNCRDKAELCEDRAGERTGRPGTTEVQGQGISNNFQKKENKNNFKNKIRMQ